MLVMPGQMIGGRGVGGISIIDPTNYTHVAAGAADIDTVDLGGGDVAFGSVGGLIVHPDKDKFLVSDYNNDIHHFDGVSAEDFSGATQQLAKSNIAGSTGALSLALNPNDPAKIVNVRNNTTLTEYTIGSGFNSSSLTQGSTFAAGAITNFVIAAAWSPDGSHFLFSGFDTTTIHVLECPTPFSLTGASRNTDLEINLGFVCRGIFIEADYKSMMFLDDTNDRLSVYILGTAKNPSTGAEDTAKRRSISTISTNARAMYVPPDKKQIYLGTNDSGAERIHVLKKKSLATDLGVVYLGDSLINTLVDTSTNTDDTNEDLGVYYDNITLEDVAIGGIALTLPGGVSGATDAMMDSDDSSFTTDYTGRINGIDDFKNVQVVCYSFGTNAVTVTADDQATYLRDLEVMIDDLKDTFPNLRAVIPLGWNRHTGRTDAQWQAARETKMLEFDIDPIIKRGAELYDIASDEQEKIHPSVANEPVYNARLNNRILAELGQISSVGTIGAEATSGTFTDGSANVTIQVTHDGGTSLSGTETANFHFEVNGSPATISSMVVNADNIVFTLSAALSSGDVVKFWPVWGNGDWVVADLVKDNNGLPLIQTKALTVAEI